MRPRTLLALLLVVPFVDALFLIYVATRLGAVLTVALVVLTAILGMLLLRAEGRATIARVQRKLARGEPPTDELLDGGLLIAAGALLLTPGLVTDAIGFLLALPLSRVPIRVALKRYVVIPYIDRETDGFVTGNVYVGGFPWSRRRLRGLRVGDRQLGVRARRSRRRPVRDGWPRRRGPVRRRGPRGRRGRR